MDTRAGPSDRRTGPTGSVAAPVGVRLTALQRLGATGGIAGIVLLLGLLTYGGLSSTRAARADVAKTHRAVEATQSVLQDIVDAETGQRGFLLTSDEGYLEPYHAALNRLAADRVLLRTLAASDPVQTHDLDSLSTAIDAKVAELASTIEIMRTRGFQATRIEVDTHLGQRKMEVIRGAH